MCRRHLGWNQIIIGDGEMLNNDQALQKIVRHAYGTVSFYQNLMDCDTISESMEIDKLPIVDKGFMVRSGNSMLSSRYIGKYI